MSNKKALLTVVVPMYNVAAYLKECLDSLSSQTLNELNVILVDDGSTDSTSEIAQDYCLKKDNFLYVSKPNGGLSSARNFGLKLVNTKYVAFLDSDDWVSPLMYGRLVTAADKNNSEIAVCGMNLVYENGETIACPLEPKVVDISEEYVEAFEAIRVAAWDKVYLTEIFNKNKVLYPEGLFYEDTPVTTALLTIVKRVSIISDCFYNYRQRDGSITKSNKFEYKYLDIFDGVKWSSNLFNDSIKKNELYIYVLYKKCILDSIIRMSIFGSVNDISIHKVKGEIKLISLFRSRLELLHKLVILSFRVFPRATLYLINMLK